MKFIKDGWHWLEIDEYGNIIGSLTNSEHAAILKQARLEYAQNWFHAHTDWNTLMAYPDYLHEVIHAIQHHSNTVLSALGVNLVASGERKLLFSVPLYIPHDHSASAGF